MRESGAAWTLTGESLVGLARCRGPRTPMPAGLRRLPGPCLIAALRIVDSPAGEYLELAIGEPARLGWRPGWCLTTVVVDSEAARLDGQGCWGPMEVGTLRWRSDGRERELVWVERGLVLRGRPMGPPLPALVPVRALRHGAEGGFLVPGRLRGQARFSRLSVEVRPGDCLSGLAGHHPGAVVSGAQLRVLPARRPVAVRATLRAPLRAPGAALWFTPAATPPGPTRPSGARAYSSVG